MPKATLTKRHLKTFTALSVVAGILYSSWPLGHWLNPAVSRTSLASGLEAVGQPYNWVFIGGDILSSLVVIVLSILLWRKVKSSKSYKLIHASLVCVILFSVGTIIDAMLPLKCVQGIEVCPSFTKDHLLLAHGVFSILASVFLFVSLLIFWLIYRQDKLTIALLVGYVLFGIISLAEAVLPGKNGNWSQDYYITLCSVFIALVPYLIYQIQDR